MRRHALIGGTGRAGTTFLVQFLDACGLETGADDAQWYGRARAGLEHHLDSDAPAPYVVKDPFLFAYCEELDLTEVSIEALILPMRDLISAAESRVHQERLALTDTWAAERRASQIVGATPGGVLYSLDVVDQARILAVGFHKLLHWAVLNELPLFLLSFPRMVEDQEYLIRVLWPWLSRHCTRERAREAFSETAAMDAIRIGHRATETKALPLAPGEPDPAELDRRALRERLEEQNRELALAAHELESVYSSTLWKLAQRLEQHPLANRVAQRIARWMTR